MNHFTAHRLRFVTEVQRTIELNEHQGSAIRGAPVHGPATGSESARRRGGESAREDWMTSVANIEEKWKISCLTPTWRLTPAIS
jgi:hypothetical protein